MNNNVLLCITTYYYWMSIECQRNGMEHGAWSLELKVSASC